METETHRGYYTTEEQKEEIMEEKRDKAKAPNLIGEDYSGKRFGYKIPNGYEFDCIKNNEIILKPKQYQYPKTYEECCKVLGIEYLSDSTLEFFEHGSIVIGQSSYQHDNLALINTFIKLKLCRDAYWKIAGNRKNNSQFKYLITCWRDNIILLKIVSFLSQSKKCEMLSMRTLRKK